MGEHQGKSLIQRAKAFDQIERLWADERFVAMNGREADDLREFITVFLLQQARAGKITWRTLYEQATAGRYRAQIGYWQRSIIRADLPRYAPPEPRGYGRPCPVPKTRGKNAGQPCGRHYVVAHRVTDPETGEWQLTGWCRTHEAYSRAAIAREKSLTNVPEPLPNTGGLLPSYLPNYDWRLMYERADERWKEPYVGIVADQWPVLAKTQTAPVGKPALTSLDGGGDDKGPVGPPPALRLVTTDREGSR